MTAVILAVAAVATAWATFQASQWSGAQSDAVAASSTARTESIRFASIAGEREQIDTAVWLQWLDAVSQKDTVRARFLSDRFRPPLSVAQKQWVAKAKVAADGKIISVPAGTPFDEPSYVLPAGVRSEELSARAADQLAESQDDADTSTAFVTTALVLALVLFFAGIATKFRAPKMQVLLVVLAVGFGLFGLIRMLTLPQLL